MATGILMPSAVVANPIDIIPPAVANLSLWAYLGTDLAHSPNAGGAGALVNQAAGGPVWSPHYASMKGSTGALQLASFTATSSQTFMCAARYIGGGTNGAAGTIMTPPTGTAGLIVSETTTTMTLAASGIIGAVPLTLVNAGNWKFLAATTQAGGPHTLYNLTDNTSQVAAASGTASVAANAVIGIGGLPGGTNDRGVDLAFVAWAQTVLTLPQIQAQYAAVKATLAQFGIAV